jgi:acetyl esterase/lipase
MLAQLIMRRTGLSMDADNGLAPQPIVVLRPAMPNDRKVFLDYTQAELDQAYDQLVWAPHRDAIQAEIRKDCEAVRQKMPPRTERYGESEQQVLDIFAPTGASRRRCWSTCMAAPGCAARGSTTIYPAPALTGRGAALVVPEFDNVSVVSLPQMIEQCREAVDWTVRNAKSFGGDPDRVYLAGHSSGAHLASCVLLGDPPVKGALLISGMYDLHAPLALGPQQVREDHAGGARRRQRHAPSRPHPLPRRRRLVGRRQPGVPPPGAGLSPPRCRAWAGWRAAPRSSRPTTSRNRASSPIPTARSAACCSR